MLLEELARRPQRQLEVFTHEATERTLSCGDEVTIRVRVVGSDIQEIGWSGHGCTVSMAATAALSGLAPLPLPEFPKLQGAYVASVNGGEALDDDLEPFAGIGRFPLRAQCSTLAWRALAAALARPDRSSDVSGEPGHHGRDRPERGDQDSK